MGAKTLMSQEQHWQSVYHQREPEQVSWYQECPALSMELIRATGVPLDAPIIDVGGGSSRLVDALLSDGYENISVLDISSAALAQSQARLGAKAGKLHWIHTDITRFQPPETYQVWHDRAVFHFLTEAEDRQRYIQILTQALQPQGHFILATFATDGPNKCSGLPVEQYDEDKVLRVLGPAFQLLDTRRESHVTPAGVEQRFIYFHLLYA